MILLAEIGPNGLHELLKRQWSREGQHWVGGSSGRKADFSTRLQIDTENHKHLIQARVKRLFHDHDIRDAIAEHVDVRRNVLKRVVDRVATPYETPPLREIAGISEDAQRAFLDAYREAKTDTTASTWSRYGFLLNVVHVIPRIESTGLHWVTVLPHECDVVWDPAGEHDPSILVYGCKDRGARYVAVDRERWWWLDKDYKIVDEEEHPEGWHPSADELGPTPWAEFRVADRQPGDYWCRGAGQALVDGALQVGMISAQLEWSRRTHAKKLITLQLGDNDESPPGQTMQGETAFITRGDQTRFAVHDTVVGVGEFLAHISSIVEDLAESYGLPATEIDPSSASTQDAANAFGPAGPRNYERIAKLRTSMLKHLRLGEHQLADRAGILLAATGRLGGVTREDIRRGFRCSWLPLTFADTPKSQIDTAIAGMSIGATDPVVFYQSQNPGLTFDEAAAAVQRHIEVRAQINEFQARRNMPSDPAHDGQSLAQMQGRIGGNTAAANSSPDGEQAGRTST